jgi:hypothetical protein
MGCRTKNRFEGERKKRGFETAAATTKRDLTVRQD